MLLDQVSVGNDAGRPRDRSPVARGVDEGDVDVGVALQLVCLVRLGIRVEKQINAPVFLSTQC